MVAWFYFSAKATSQKCTTKSFFQLNDEERVKETEKVRVREGEKLPELTGQKEMLVMCAKLKPSFGL